MNIIEYKCRKCKTYGVSMDVEKRICPNCSGSMEFEYKIINKIERVFTKGKKK